MRRILSISWVFAALACGSVKDKQACGASTECPAGQYCAHAGGESRCWADAVVPVVGTVTASCDVTPCLRDGVLHVTAAVTDDAEVLDASVSLDLPGASPVPMTRNGGAWVADVELRNFSFPAYSRDVTASVVARDGARNSSQPANAGAVGVTRLRWERAIDGGGAILAPTAPAMKSDGTVVVGGSNGKLYFIAPDSSDARAPLLVGTGQISAAPAIGMNAIWVGSEDFTLYAVELDGSAVKSGIGVNTGGAIKGSVAVLTGAGKEWAFATSSAGFLGATSTVSAEYAIAGPTVAFSIGPVVGVDARLYAATTGGSLDAYRLNTAPAVTLTQAWSTPVGVEVGAPIVFDSAGSVWSAAVEKLSKTVPGDSSGSTSAVATLPARITDSPVVLANGDLVLGDHLGIVRRVTASGSSAWTSNPNLGAATSSALVLTGGDAAFVIPTSGGKLFALEDNGSEVWSAPLDSGNSLRAANIYTPPGQTTNIMSTAYLASSSGKLFAVVVDGQLDAAAPWPKAFHDPRNTNRAGPQP